MTYSTYKNYTFSAFAEKDLGGNICKGAKFTMPGSATLSITVTDNDAHLSADNYRNERADDWSGQHASILDAHGNEIGNGTKAYAETVWKLKGSDGKIYKMVEIEQSGSLPDSFSFFGGTPPAGVTLTVVGCSNWSNVAYSKLDATPPAPPVPTQYCIEAESMWESGFHIAHGSQASNGAFLKLNCAGGNGDASATFGGVSGTYDLTIRAQDESDGQSTIMVKINGVVVGSIDLDRDTDGRGSDHGAFSDFTLKGLNINSGDKVSLWVDGDHGEFVRLDKLTFDPAPQTGSVSGNVFCDLDCDGIDDVGATTVTKGANVLQDGDFEAGRTHYNSDGYGAWYDAGRNTGDIIQGTGRGSFNNASSNEIFELDCGSILCQNFHVSTAGKYCLTFDVYKNSKIGSSNNDFKVKINGNTVKDVKVNSDGTVTLELDLSAGSNRIDFVSGSSVGGKGPAVDNIAIQELISTTAPGEPGKAGVTVKLVDLAGAVVATTTTDANGDYSFGNVAVGDYKVMVVAPSGQVFTIQDAGTDDSVDSDVDGNGMSGTVSVTAGGNVVIDAGLKDAPLPGSLSGRYFCDDNNNGVDDGEPGVAGVTVELLDAAGNPTGATTTTGADGSYSFGNLAPGTYGVKFTDTVSGKTLVAADVGSDDSIDSDATDLGGGMSQITGITVVSGQDTPDNDAGVETVVPPNGDPTPAPDAGKVCVEDGGVFNVLANDTDPDGDTLSVLTIADADETVGVGGTLTLASGATATLNADGTITYDGTTGSNAGLLVGQEAAEEQITYTVSDGNGGSASSTLDITACGSTSTLQMICDSLPAQIDLSIALTGSPLDYQITVFDGAGAADDKLASATWNGFCIDINGTLLLDTTVTANVYTSCDPIPAGLIANPNNLDNIEWLINQNLNGASNLAGTDTYDVFDLQEAVWVLSDGATTNNADANEIAQMALSMGEGFVAQEGDQVAVIFDPIAPAGSGVTDTQTFIMGVDWDAIELDCIC